MATHAEAVEILVRKGRFEPEVALSITEAIEVSINLSQLVTVPVLDARLQELRHDLMTEIQTVRTELHTFRAEIRGEFRAELAAGLGQLGTQIQKVNANLMRWMFLTTLGSVALSMAGRVIVKTLGY